MEFRQDGGLNTRALTKRLSYLPFSTMKIAYFSLLLLTYKMRKSHQTTHPKIVIPPDHCAAQTAVSEMETKTDSLEKRCDSSHFTPTKAHMSKSYGYIEGRRIDPTKSCT